MQKLCRILRRKFKRVCFKNQGDFDSEDRNFIFYLFLNQLVELKSGLIAAGKNAGTKNVGRVKPALRTDYFIG